MTIVWRIRRKLIRTVLSCVQGGHKPGNPGTLGEFSEPGKLGGILREKL